LVFLRLKLNMFFHMDTPPNCLLFEFSGAFCCDQDHAKE
jgi:hypothetical protein